MEAMRHLACITAIYGPLIAGGSRPIYEGILWEVSAQKDRCVCTLLSDGAEKKNVGMMHTAPS